MTRRSSRLGWSLPSRRLALLAVVTGLFVAVFSLVWLAYSAVAEWRRSTIQLVDQRSEEALTLLTVALSRDMKGVHDSVLGSLNEASLDLEKPFELESLFGQAFARFPYPESFFVWRESANGGPTVVFNRVDRPPRWAEAVRAESAYPVVSLWNTAVGRDLVAQARTIGESGHRFGTFETTLGGSPYQVIVHLLYHTQGDRRLFGAVGFTVNLNWVKDEYFDDILRQISAIGDIEGSISLAVSDDTGTLIASTRPVGELTGVLHSRTFPLSFLDPDLAPDAEPAIQSPREWTASVSAVNDQMLAAATRGSSRTLWLVVVAAGAVVMGVAFTLRALKASADLADMQSEFISSATHELKTPLAVFHLVAETLMKGRYQSAETIRLYAGMLSDQTHLLERLIDNLLAYGSLGHVAQRYAFQPVSVSEIVESALERFDARLAATGMDVKIDLSPELPKVQADRQSLLQVFDNVIDNAIKYSREGDSLIVKGSAVNGLVHIEIADRGVGIPVDERVKVFEKFYRGRNTAAIRGSGLGLAIARQVVEDHGGRIELRSGDPKGTIVDIGLPIAS